MNKNQEQIDHCSFCNKHKDQIGKLIVSYNVAICNECVELCDRLLEDHKTSPDPKNFLDIPDPAEIKAYLDQYVIGQNDAKIVLSVAVTNHFKRISTNTTQIQKANILMIGPTGTGKTLLVKTIAKYLKVPFVIGDATCLTEAGYVGDDVESLVSRLYQASNGDKELCQRGIIFLDEVDKIARKSESATVARDVSGEGVQQALLKLIEGTQCRIPAVPGKKTTADTVEIDTSNILFVAGGAFIGLDRIVKNRLQGTAIGFNAQMSESNSTVESTTTDDLVRYGLIPEFVGRFSTFVNLSELTKEQLIEILINVKDSFIEQYKTLFVVDGVELIFEKDSIEMIADRTIKNKTGARGLHAELERVLLPHMFNLPNYRRNNILKVVISKDQVNTPETLVEQNS